MQPPKALTSLAAGLVVAGAVLIGAAAPASAHVGASGDIAPGGFGTVTFTVPSERDDANTTKIEVKVDPDHPLGSLRVQPKAGWTVTTTTRAVDQPIEVFGSEVTEVVDTITWQTEGVGIAPGQFEEFEVRGGPFPEDVDAVAFPTIQTYSSGEEVGWVQPVVEGEDEPELPTPVLQLTGESDDDEAAAPTVSGAADDDDDGGSDGLAIAGLVAGLLGLAAGGAALLKGRKAGS
jgi:periplasmic copper chaperone A